jgi:hypothetical protein
VHCRRRRQGSSHSALISHSAAAAVAAAAAAAALRATNRHQPSLSDVPCLHFVCSAGKTTLVEYLAARCGHRCVRINNHEHTDTQEYTGSYAADESGKLTFVEVRQGCQALFTVIQSYIYSI